MRNWAIVYAGNLVGALGTVLLVFLGGQYEFGDGAVGSSALAIADAKSGLGFGRALALGIMCNALVCLAVWLTYSARSVTDKILAIIFPITRLRRRRLRAQRRQHVLPAGRAGDQGMGLGLVLRGQRRRPGRLPGSDRSPTSWSRT